MTGTVTGVLRIVTTSLIGGLLAISSVAAQSPSLVTSVRQAVAEGNLGRGEQLVNDYRRERGVTPEMLAALSWLARGAVTAEKWDTAERYAADTYKLATPLLSTRPLDQEANLPTAVGAAIEVLAQVDAARGARSDAVLFLRGELRKFAATSIEKRIQKNINLLSMEGAIAPALDLSDYLGERPPAVSALKGKVVLLFFWAHWCPDCKAEAPILATMAARYASRGLIIVAPTQRFGYVAGGAPAPPDEETRYIDAIRQKFFPVLAGLPLPLSEANHRRYGVSSTPTLVLVDRAGIVRMYHPGKMTEDELDARIKPLVAGGTH